MRNLIGKWVQAEGQAYEGLWFEFREDHTFVAEYEPMGIVSSGTYSVTGTEEPEDRNITINQTEHTLGLVGEFKGLIEIEENTLKMVLSASPGGDRPDDLTGARIYEKVEKV